MDMSSIIAAIITAIGVVIAALIGVSRSRAKEASANPSGQQRSKIWTEDLSPQSPSPTPQVLKPVSQSSESSQGPQRPAKPESIMTDDYASELYSQLKLNVRSGDSMHATDRQFK